MPANQTAVEFPSDVVAEIDHMVGASRRGTFLVELVRREIKRQRLLKALEYKDPIWKDEDHPEMGGDSDNWIKEMRREAEVRFQRIQSSGAE